MYSSHYTQSHPYFVHRVLLHAAVNIVLVVFCLLGGQTTGCETDSSVACITARSCRFCGLLVLLWLRTVCLYLKYQNITPVIGKTYTHIYLLFF
jgi:hypothetical protein